MGISFFNFNCSDVFLLEKTPKSIFLTLIGNDQGLTGDATGVPGHRVGDVVLFGGSDDHPCSCAVREADSHGAITASPVRRQNGPVAVDFHLGISQRRQVTIVKHLNFYLYLCGAQRKRESQSALNWKPMHSFCHLQSTFTLLAVEMNNFW